MTLEEFLDRLPGPKRQRSGYWMACCPAHDDRHASLAVKMGENGKILVKCHAGCSFEAVAERLESLGASLSPGPGDRSSPNTAYVYTDALYRPILKKVRIDRPDGSKSFLTKGWDRDNDRYASNASNLTKSDTDGLLYNLPMVVRAVKAGTPVHLCEGEKAADEMVRRGMVATCTPYGAGAGKFTPSHAKHLEGAHVVIWADRDEVGESYASEVAAMLADCAASVAIVQSATTGRHDDAYDHFASGFSLAEAVERSDLIPQIGHAVHAIVEFRPEPVQYLWEPYLPLGKLVLLDADGGVGKTSVCVALAAGLSRGVLPNQTEPTVPPARTVYYGVEDTGGELRVVFDACEGDPSMFLVCNAMFSLTDRELVNLRSTIRQTGARLVVFDALAYYLEGIAKDLNVAADVAPVLRKLNAVANETGCTILAIRHTVKGTVGRDASNLGMGSAQFRNTARGQLLLRYHPDRRQYPGCLVLTNEKGNLLTPKGPPVKVYRRGYAVQWAGTLDVDPFSAETKPKVSRVESGPHSWYSGLDE